MTLKVRPLAELTEDALRILYSELGLVDTTRFITQFTTGYGNYTEERRALIEQDRDEDVLRAIYAYQERKEKGQP